MKSSAEIQALFNGIAQKYDFMNNIISFGTHYFIKKRAVKKLKFDGEVTVLDLCCGTGDISKILSEIKDVKKVVGLDFSDNMLEIAKKKNFHEKIEYVSANCTKLPFEDNSFDAVTMCFGLRNIPDKETALKEIYRVLKPNGQFLHIDFGKRNFLADYFFDNLVPVFAKIFYKNSEPYKYLIKTKQEFYTPEELIKCLDLHNFKLKNEYNFLLSVISSQIYIKN